MHSKLQFAYQEKAGVEDAIIYILHWSLIHLDRSSSAVRMTFLDFSSAFNTIQVLLQMELYKRQEGGVDIKLIQDIVVWCNLNHLQLKFIKTKEMVVVPWPSMVTTWSWSHKYLGVRLDERLEWIYQSAVARGLYVVLCCRGIMRKKDSSWLATLVRKVGSVVV